MGKLCVGEANCYPAIAMQRRFENDEQRPCFIECPIVTAIAGLAITAQALIPLLLGQSDDDEPEMTERDATLSRLKLDQVGD
jgi:hypothetical protein